MRYQNDFTSGSVWLQGWMSRSQRLVALRIAWHSTGFFCFIGTFPVCSDGCLHFLDGQNHSLHAGMVRRDMQQILDTWKDFIAYAHHWWWGGRMTGWETPMGQVLDFLGCNDRHWPWRGIKIDEMVEAIVDCLDISCHRKHEIGTWWLFVKVDENTASLRSALQCAVRVWDLYLVRSWAVLEDSPREDQQSSVRDSTW